MNLTEVKNFLTKVFDAERKAWFEDLNPDTEKRNKTIQDFYSFFDESLENQLGIVSSFLPFYSEEEQKEYGKVKYEDNRILFKISQYKNDKFGDVYLAYVSNFNPRDYKAILHCFFIGTVSGQPKILKVYTLSEDSDKIWEEVDGITGLTFKTIGKPVSIDRILEPIDEDLSIQEYKKEI